MPTQTSYFQRDVLQSAQERGDLAGLYWFVEAEWPRRMVPAGVKARQPAMWPKGFIPTIPAGPDVEEQQAWAELLAGLFESGNQSRGVVFKPTLTTADLLEGLCWYEYGEPVRYEVDYICPKCGQVQRVPVGVKPRCECYEW
jgi:hypothetical protein